MSTMPVPTDPTGGWLNLGSTVLSGMLGGGSKSDASAGGSQSAGGALNTSGWVVGAGDASGGALDAALSGEGMPEIPWYGWAIGALVVAVLIKRSGN